MERLHTTKKLIYYCSHRNQKINMEKKNQYWFFTLCLRHIMVLPINQAMTECSQVSRFCTEKSAVLPLEWGSNTIGDRKRSSHLHYPYFPLLKVEFSFFIFSLEKDNFLVQIPPEIYFHDWNYIQFQFFETLFHRFINSYSNPSLFEHIDFAV